MTKLDFSFLFFIFVGNLAFFLMLKLIYWVEKRDKMTMKLSFVEIQYNQTKKQRVKKEKIDQYNDRSQQN